MDSINLILIMLLLLVALFDFTNGFHDAADMVATAIASRAMKPAVAITIVTCFTFIAPFTVGLAVTDTVGTFVNISSASPLAGESVVVAALLTAVSYNLRVPGLLSNYLNKMTANSLLCTGIYLPS